MTSQKIKFYKFSNSATQGDKIALAKATEGAVIYLVDVRELWIGGATANDAKLVIKGANDVTFANNVLTLTHYDNTGTATTQTLDFSDVASASSTMTVFNQIYTKMGLTGENHDTLDYTGTNYLTSATNLVDADKALDTAIHTNTHKGAATGAHYDTQHLSQTWTTVVNANAIAANETLDADIDKLDKKIAGLADEVIANEQVTQEAFSAVANSVGLESDMSLNLSSASSTGAIHNDTDVKSALIHLDNAISTNQLDVRVGGTSIVDNHVANIITEGTYNSSSNKIATQSTVSDAINALDVNTDKGAASISGSTITINAVQQENGLIKDGGPTTINLDGTYNATDNKIATKSTVTTAIEALDTTADVQAVDYTAADTTNGAKLTFKGVSETDGKIAQGTGDTVLQFAKVATTGTAADVAIVDANNKITATDVEGALTELATNIENLVGGMRYNGDISSATATLNTSTNDIRPGDIYLASGAFPIGTTSVEAGDMIVYKGDKSTSTVALDNTNCTIIEKETDTMVTAGDTLTPDYVVFGNGNKEVTTTSNDSYTISASDLNTAITKANSALQSISKGTDGTYVTTTVGSKDSNNDQSVGVEVELATVTYTAKSGNTPANLSVETGNEGVLTDAAITPIKNYVDAKVGTAVQSVDGSATEKDKSVTQSDYAAVKVTATTDNDKNVTLDTVVGLTVQAVSTSDPSSAKGLAEASDVKTYVDNQIAGLDADVTSDDAVVANVEVKQVDGKINDVIVTTNAAGVSYTASTASTQPGLSATTGTGAVTGADIATIKSYVDDKVQNTCWEEYE